MEISILEAAKTLKIGRSTIYKKIESGELSRLHSGKLDTSELFRVFGSSVKTPKTPTRHTPKTPVDTSQDTTKTLRNTSEPSDLSAQLAHLQAENTQLRERLEEYKERESWHKEKIDTLLDTVKLLEAPRPAPPASFFARLLEKLK